MPIVAALILLAAAQATTPRFASPDARHYAD